MNFPPSENESGVTFTIPINNAGRGNVNSNLPQRSNIRQKPEIRTPKSERNPRLEIGNETVAVREISLLFGTASSWRLDQFYLVSLRRIYEGDPMSIRGDMRPIRVFHSLSLEVFAEILKAIHFESQMGQIRLDLHRPARREIAQLDQFITRRCFHEGQLRTPRRFVPPHLLQPQYVFVK